MAVRLARGGGLLAGLGRYHHQPAVTHAALGDDVIGKVLQLGTGASQRRYLHAVVVFEMVKTRGAEIGLRTKLIPKLESSSSLFLLDSASEILFAGDASPDAGGTIL